MRLTSAVILGALVFALALARSIADGVGMGDESWFLQVIARIRAGDILYREVFLGVTPLSAYATAGVSLFTGVDVLAVKIVTSGCFAATSVLAVRLARQSGLSAGASLAVAAAMFVWGRPYNNPPYTAMAVMFFVAALGSGVSVRASDRGDVSRLAAWFAVGLLAGLSFAAKQNVGLLALAAVWTAIVIPVAGEWRVHLPRLAASAAGFALTALLVLAPVVRSGALAAFWDYGFAAKGAYLSIGDVPFTDSLRALLASAASLPSPSAALGLLHDAVVLLPIATLLIVVFTARRLDRTDWMFVLFAATATLAALPRWDRFHMGYAVALHLIAIARIATYDSGRALRWLVFMMAATVAAQPLVTLARGHRLNTMPHFRGALMEPAEAASLTASAAKLAQASDGRPVFVLTPHSGFWYLASGVRNPTPFDTPHRTAVGSSGIPWLIEQLHTGAIDRVCVSRGSPDAQTLTEVADYVRARFVEGANAGPCTMFQRSFNLTADHVIPRP
jgi:hypothetical protein